MGVDHEKSSILRSAASPAFIPTPEITHWLKQFFLRFMSQQFKRSTLPPGPKVGSVSLSPRGDWRMPDEATANAWIDEIDRFPSNEDTE
jgi:hypothetical protein